MPCLELTFNQPDIRGFSGCTYLANQHECGVSLSFPFILQEDDTCPMALNACKTKSNLKRKTHEKGCIFE